MQSFNDVSKLSSSNHSDGSNCAGSGKWFNSILTKVPIGAHRNNVTMQPAMVQ